MDALTFPQAMSLGDDELETPTCRTGESDDDILVVARSEDTQARTLDWSPDGSRGIRPPYQRAADYEGLIRVVIYARYSSSLQNPLSVADQLHVCREYAARHPNWKIVGVYHDDAISGQTILQRPGVQQLLQAVDRQEFDLLLCESMSRISRSHEMGMIHARLQFAGIRMVTLAESGEINDLHIGLKGTMNALYLKDLAHAVRRGQTGMTLHGRLMGRAYGYEIVREVDADGELIRGLRRINEVEAEIVQRIFREYAAGVSPLAIARGLNADGIPGPTGKTWQGTSIRGNPVRHEGILNNVIYIGKLVYNRTKHPKNPTTGKHVTRMNPPDQWVIVERADLRIVDQELWDAAKKQQEDLVEKYAGMVSRRTATLNLAAALNATHRPRTLLSGLLVCGHCGGSYVGRGVGKYHCYNRMRKDACPNWRSISRTELEERVFAALRGPLLNPEVLVEATQGYVEEIKRLNRERTASYNSAGKRLSQVENAISELVFSLENDGQSRALRRRLDDLEREQQELELTLTGAPPEDIPAPSIDAFRARIIRLSEGLGGSVHDGEAVAVIRDLIDHITITPNLDDGPKTGSNMATIDVTLHGDLAKILDRIVGDRAFFLMPSVGGCKSPHRDRQMTAIKI